MVKFANTQVLCNWPGVKLPSPYQRTEAAHCHLPGGTSWSPPLGMLFVLLLCLWLLPFASSCSIFGIIKVALHGPKQHLPHNMSNYAEVDQLAHDVVRHVLHHVKAMHMCSTRAADNNVEHDGIDNWSIVPQLGGHGGQRRGNNTTRCGP